MGDFAHQVVQVASRLYSRAATEQGGVISGDNPTHYNASNPLRLWVIQVVLIIAMTQLLSIFLARIRQPRVIAEVIGGVILGPTVMGRIPNFRATVFPDASMPLLNLTSTIGLVLFLFLVGLEIDTRMIKRNITSSAAVSVAGLLIPLGLGAALGVGVYREFIDPSVNFGYFILFTAVAIGITAFPVLCRILTELKLLETTVGVVVLSAGIGNDVVGWILLALAVALTNASTGLTALWVLLASVGYVIVLLWPGRLAFLWLARRTGSLERGTPTASMMTLTILVVFISAFFTDIIGVHAIFGGFLAGLIIPHENGFAISLVEKLEDLVSLLFLPIYFTLSGLRTNLGLLDNGVTWGYTIIICLLAFASKFFACAFAAYTTGFNWREAGAIGSLMSCKGLVELIVLNIGLQAGILDTRTFSMFVVHALILTFMTTPLTLLFYPPKYRFEDKGRGKRATEITQPDAPPLGRKSTSDDDGTRTKFAIILDKIEQLPAAMTLAQLIQPSPSSSYATLPQSLNEKSEKSTPASPSPVSRFRITFDALRLIELTNRTSAVLRSKEADSLIYNDPIISVFRTFGNLNRLLVSATLRVLNHDEFPEAIAKHVTDNDSEMVILPWSRGATSVVDEEQIGYSNARNPFDGIFHKTTTQDQTSSVVYSELIRNVFLNTPSDVALFVDRGLSVQYSGPSDLHLFLGFFGGPDDRLALSFLVQICANPLVTATVIRMVRLEDLTPISTVEEAKMAAGHHSGAMTTMAAADTVYGQHTTQTRLVSDTADNLLWDRYTLPSISHPASTSLALSRITFSSRSSTKPLRTVADIVNSEIAQTSAGKTLIVLAGRSRRMAVDSYKGELATLITENGSSIGSSVPRTMGDVGAALVATGTTASLLILQARKS